MNATTDMSTKQKSLELLARFLFVASTATATAAAVTMGMRHSSASSSSKSIVDSVDNDTAISTLYDAILSSGKDFGVSAAIVHANATKSLADSIRFGAIVCGVCYCFVPILHESLRKSQFFFLFWRKHNDDGDKRYY